MRSFESPYNENLVLSSVTGAGGLANGVLGDTSNLPLRPGARTQVNAGFQQALGKHLLLDMDYFIKRTNNAYDFNVLFNTSVTFPISWQKSKVDGASLRLNMTNYKDCRHSLWPATHGRVSFHPRPAGCSSIPICRAVSSGSITIRNSSKRRRFNISSRSGRRSHRTSTSPGGTTVVWWQVQFRTLLQRLNLTADQQAQIGLFCGSTFATPTSPILACTDTNRGALRVRIPADGY